jgi:hypothetical protein
MTLTGFNVPYSYIYKKYLKHIHPCLSSSFTSLSTLPILQLPSPLYDLFCVPVLHCLSVCSLFSGILLWYFTINKLYFNLSNPLYLTLFLLPCIVQQFSFCLKSSFGSVLAIYCCITNYPKISNLKQQAFMGFL